jgi:NmrA-like family
MVTAKELRKNDKIVHALVRDKTTAPAKVLEELGCILFEDTQNEIAVVAQAIKGVSGSFLNIFPDSEDPTTELR